MILGFKPQFVDKILSGSKIHTIREDKHNRWKAGNKIQFATGVRTKDYKQFFEGECTGIQKIEIFGATGEVIVDGRRLSLYGDDYKLLFNDGFDSLQDFFNWFGNDFSGKIIHWTNFTYK